MAVLYWKQRLFSHWQVSNWAGVTAGVPKASIEGTLLFLCYINYLATGLSTNVKLLADDKSVFSVTHDINTSAHKLKMTWLKLNFGMENEFQSRS